MADAQWPAETPAGTPLRFCVRDAEVLIRRAQDRRAALPDAVPEGSTHVLGWLDGRLCLAVDGTDHAAPEGLEWCNLRALYRLIDETLWSIAGRAAQLVDWDRSHRICGRCGTPKIGRASCRERV